MAMADFCFGTPGKSSNGNRQISGEDLFGDAGSPEALEMIYNARARKPEKKPLLKTIINALRRKPHTP